MNMRIRLDFGPFTLDATFFDTPVAQRLYDSLPQTVDLTGWGRELYGSVRGNHGSFNPVSKIPVGGLAYTERGSYFCIFFGQDPAWPVEHIGTISGDGAEQLNSHSLTQVTIQRNS
ncbi:MAG: hypothetical protein JXX29_12185 [Deltaproteobacteria bacterium]|nr:hypothetical protein [Deltaproteobacteria bacterium]MBN2672432.1 hypothetical protein [Deltaproteobacteria bacterium]